MKRTKQHTPPPTDSASILDALRDSLAPAAAPDLAAAADPAPPADLTPAERARIAQQNGYGPGTAAAQGKRGKRAQRAPSATSAPASRVSTPPALKRAARTQSAPTSATKGKRATSAPTSATGKRAAAASAGQPDWAERAAKIAASREANRAAGMTERQRRAIAKELRAQGTSAPATSSTKRTAKRAIPPVRAKGKATKAKGKAKAKPTRAAAKSAKRATGGAR